MRTVRALPLHTVSDFSNGFIQNQHLIPSRFFADTPYMTSTAHPDLAKISKVILHIRLAARDLIPQVIDNSRKESRYVIYAIHNPSCRNSLLPRLGSNIYRQAIH